ncbi:PIN domain-containing protein [Flavobacterium daemonense]|uniref:EVE domain-containing protein n=1 Tax=Flavobacterium daemonense TaxID=1393049 RepID=UPI001187220C|nr:EVE domain-containing protein [Flavobacterium daemonense]KAF2330707.1 EVE domain-containing protein [Flavobacterium daemonense]
MRILIDTNILINLEDNKVIIKQFSEFYRLAITNNCQVLYHPKAIPIDINRDKDLERKAIINSKLDKYEKLKDFAQPTQEFVNLIGQKKINDEIDNRQLYQLYKDYVDVFVTQDKGIHNNAKKVNLQTKVLDINEILYFLEEQFTIKIPTHPILKEHSVREIENKFGSVFFDSLREDYGGEVFDNWLLKCANKNRKCYSLIVEEELQALLIYNLETVEEHQLLNVFEKALKICTFKVSNTAFGIKLGELFLHKMFEYCINQKINYLYLTVYEKQVHLIKLLEMFGFYKVEFLNKQDLIEIQMIKCLNKTKLSSNDNVINNHPFYFDNELVSKFAIPIRPDYYEKLFKDGKLRDPSLFDNSPDSVNEIQGNTIIKAYISNSKITKLKRGDLLFFYSSKTNQEIEPVGILETIQIVKDFDELWKLVSKKTVFSQEDLFNKLNEKKELNVITFRLVTYLRKKVKLVKIKEMKSFKNKIQTITKISEIDYQELKNEGYFDKRYIID